MYRKFSELSVSAIGTIHTCLAPALPAGLAAVAAAAALLAATATASRQLVSGMSKTHDTALEEQAHGGLHGHGPTVVLSNRARFVVFFRSKRRAARKKFHFAIQAQFHLLHT